MNIPKALNEKLMKVKEILKGKRVLVAFSGGLDSSLVAYFSKKYSKKTIAVLIKAQTTPSQEIENAKKISSELQIPFEVLNIDITEQGKIYRNLRDRCYHCKKLILSELKEFISLKQDDYPNYDLFVDGTNYSDLSLERPGLKALRESEFRSPLAEAEITKEDVLKLSQIFDLPSKNIPSQACLASRVPFGIPLSQEILEMVDHSEMYIRELLDDFETSLRVRIHKLKPSEQYLARIEAGPTIQKKINDIEIAKKINTRLRKIGFIYITMDLQGFRSGSMHETIEK